MVGLEIRGKGWRIEEIVELGGFAMEEAEKRRESERLGFSRLEKGGFGVGRSFQPIKKPSRNGNRNNERPPWAGTVGQVSHLLGPYKF